MRRLICQFSRFCRASAPDSVSAGVKVNPYLPSGLCHPYQMDESISNVRACLVNFSFLFCF